MVAGDPADPVRDDAAPSANVVPTGRNRRVQVLVSGFTVLQIAVAVLIGNVMTRVLFTGWERIREEKFSLVTYFDFLAPVGMILLVLIGSVG